MADTCLARINGMLWVVINNASITGSSNVSILQIIARSNLYGAGVLTNVMDTIFVKVMA